MVTPVVHFSSLCRCRWGQCGRRSSSAADDEDEDECDKTENLPFDMVNANNNHDDSGISSYVPSFRSATVIPSTTAVAVISAVSFVTLSSFFCILTDF